MNGSCQPLDLNVSKRKQTKQGTRTIPPNLVKPSELLASLAGLSSEDSLMKSLAFSVSEANTAAASMDSLLGWKVGTEFGRREVL